ncbi:MAG: hypothetical protein DLM50_00490 [Candidatus Meridianibacter frigidus]|nr:MAG: hypothetical protein DLM50_00490 [Candidatus Eremiobacteraeota bacterium]
MKYAAAMLATVALFAAPPAQAIAAPPSFEAPPHQNLIVNAVLGLPFSVPAAFSPRSLDHSALAGLNFSVRPAVLHPTRNAGVVLAAAPELNASFASAYLHDPVWVENQSAALTSPSLHSLPVEQVASPSPVELQRFSAPEVLPEHFVSGTALAALGAPQPVLETGNPLVTVPDFSAPATSGSSLQASTAVNLPVLGRSVALKFSGSSSQTSAAQTLSGTALPQLPGSFSAQDLTPNANTARLRAVGAGAAVPLGNRLLLDLKYNREYYAGTYLDPYLSIDARKEQYLGNLTYAVPRMGGTLTLSARQYRYRDGLTAGNNLTQNRADLNFTIKF